MPELNKYCYFVAGIVGKALTQLVSLNMVGVTFDKENSVNSLHFGLFLQKINLLKDQLCDEAEGRFFIFDRLEVIYSLRKHAEAAIDYIIQIPEDFVGYRKFCSWSLFIAIGSFKYMEQAFANKNKIKISRFETKLLISLVNSVIDNDKLLKNFFLAYLNQHLPQAMSKNNTLSEFTVSLKNSTFQITL